TVMQRLIFAAENAKILLSGQESTALRIPCIAQKDGQFVDFEYAFTREKLEEICVPLIERCVGGLEEVLQKAGITEKQVDELVLVGGQTRMPAIRRRLTGFRLSSEKDVHPELGVAIGAAILGRNLSRGRA